MRMRLGVVAAMSFLLVAPAEGGVKVTATPSSLRQGDAGALIVTGVPEAKLIEGSVGDRPLTWTGPGEGFGARRGINGQARSPHSGLDYAAPTGTPVVAANRGRVALIGDFFFGGRTVALDHGQGLYTLYMHLDRVQVAEGTLVERGETIGAVGSTGRATGPHLHWGAQLRRARVDPAGLLALPVRD